MSEIYEAGVHEAGDSACAGYDMHDPTTRMAKHGVRRADERRPDRKVGGAAHARGERERTDWRTGAGSGRWCVASREGSECVCGPGGGARRYNYAHTRRSTADTERHEDGTRKARGDMQRVQSGRGRSMQVYNAPGRLAGSWAGRQGGGRRECNAGCKRGEKGTQLSKGAALGWRRGKAGRSARRLQHGRTHRPSLGRGDR
eukprot:scaffold24652_cov101-Isochrysis_galbana.AAC.3